jgi:hypothetical protein
MPGRVGQPRSKLHTGGALLLACAAAAVVYGLILGVGEGAGRPSTEVATRSRAQGLAAAAQAYAVKHGEWPKDLAVLTEGLDGAEPYVTPAMLCDAWGRPFQYDPDGPKNGGNRPDVWSLGPPSEEGAVIGNWD